MAISKIFTCTKTQQEADKLFCTELTLKEIGAKLKVRARNVSDYYTRNGLCVVERAKEIRRARAKRSQSFKVTTKQKDKIYLPNIEQSKIDHVVDTLVSGDYRSIHQLAKNVQSSKRTIYAIAHYYGIKIKDGKVIKKPSVSRINSDRYNRLVQQQISDSMAGMLSLSWLRKPLVANPSSERYYYPKSNR